MNVDFYTNNNMNNINNININNAINNIDKIQELEKINKKLNIIHDKLIFIFTPPKVGSTSLVSSFRIFSGDQYGIIHIHDEIMLEKLIGIKINVTINDIIKYNAITLGKEIYVIDIYRSPIERKISAFFEKIGPYHFNNRDEIVNRYNINKVMLRFNNIFPYLANGDHFIDEYEIENQIPLEFPFNKKYIYLEINGVKYIKLRLKDSDEWENILSDIFKFKICIIRDYQSENKIIGDLFKNFLENYKIPENYLENILNCKYLNYYYSPQEIQEYRNKWNSKMSNHFFISYTEEQYKVYEEISLENCYMDFIQTNHYIDEGCICKACIIKRNRLKKKIINRQYNGEKIIHTEAKNEFIENRVIQAKTINNTIIRHQLKNMNQGKLTINFGK